MTRNARRYITRYCYRGSGRAYWWVRFSWLGVLLISRRFYDKELGGVRKALVAAKAFRDRVAAAWQPVLVPRGYKHQPHRSSPGYHYQERRIRHGMRRYWIATWQDEGRRRRQAFQVTADRPFSRARALAKGLRERMIAERP